MCAFNSLCPTKRNLKVIGIILGTTEVRNLMKLGTLSRIIIVCVVCSHSILLKLAVLFFIRRSD